MAATSRFVPAVHEAQCVKRRYTATIRWIEIRKICTPKEFFTLTGRICARRLFSIVYEFDPNEKMRTAKSWRRHLPSHMPVACSLLRSSNVHSEKVSTEMNSIFSLYVSFFNVISGTRSDFFIIYLHISPSSLRFLIIIILVDVDYYYHLRSHLTEVDWMALRNWRHGMHLNGECELLVRLWSNSAAEFMAKHIKIVNNQIEDFIFMNSWLWGIPNSKSSTEHNVAVDGRILWSISVVMHNWWI